MNNKLISSGSRGPQLTIVFGECALAPADANHGTGPTQNSALATPAPLAPDTPGPVSRSAGAGIPAQARASSVATSKTVCKRKWYSLWDKVYALRNLERAWERVASNGGAGGADGMTIEMYARNVTARLEGLSADLKAKTYRPQPVRRVLIPKADGGKRPLGIPAIRDRIVQQALFQVLSPIFEPQFSDRSHGFRSGRGCQSALQVVDRAVRHGYTWVVDADIQGFFDNVNHDILLAALNEEVSDGSVLNTIRSILEAGVVQPDTSELEPSEIGTPQGGPLSPLLANIYLHRLDRAMDSQYGLVRYADDFVIFARSQSDAEAALARAREILEGELKLQLHPEKTRIVTVDAGFEFLGFHYFRSTKGVLIKEPRRKSMQRFRDQVSARTPRIRNQKKPKRRSFALSRLSKNQRLQRIIADVNRFLRGWYGYFRVAWLPPSTAFRTQDQIVRRRLRQALTGRVGNGWWNPVLSNHLFDHLGLVSLRQLHLHDLERRVLLPGRKT